SLEAVRGVPRSRVVRAALFCWRLDNEAAWEASGSLLRTANPPRQRVESVLRGLGPGKNTAAEEHRSFVVPGVAGVTRAEHSVILMRRWAACESNLGSPRRLAGPGPGKPGLDSVLREVPRMYGVAEYTCLCLATTLVLGRRVRDNAGAQCWPVGPGAGTAALFLTGAEAAVAQSNAVWPWQRDRRNLRAAVAAVAAELGIAFMAAQHSLCNWISE
ncbi:unnamed protein product, partial [Prorocentrum cordatum]